MNDFKIKVTPEQSKQLQESLFNLGYLWGNRKGDGTREVKNTNVKTLSFNNGYIWVMPELPMYFEFSKLPEITFDDFLMRVQKEKDRKQKNWDNSYLGQVV